MFLQKNTNWKFWPSRRFSHGTAYMTRSDVDGKNMSKVNMQKKNSCVLPFIWLFYTWYKLGENNETPRCERNWGIPSLCPDFATSITHWQEASLWIASHGHQDGIPLFLQQYSERFYWSPKFGTMKCWISLRPLQSENKTGRIQSCIQ